MSPKISVWTVFGTRPEAIKMLPLVLKMKQDPRFDVTVCVTAQHREMLDSVMALFGVEADIDFDVMTHGQNLSGLSNKILTKMSEALAAPSKFNVPAPDRVLVHGDTTTSFMVALAAYYHQVPVGHVEAGLRTHNLYSPFPEEGNRQLTRVVADLHFAPTTDAMSNLANEGVDILDIEMTGNTVIDALYWMKEKIENEPSVVGKLQGLVSSWQEEYKNIVLITGHRRENHGEGFNNICSAIATLANKHKDTVFVYPVHPNPNVKNVVEEKLSSFSNVKLVEPMGYAPFVYMMMNSTLILTDSGGIQEEAPSLNVPVLVMREETERQEAVDAGTVRLVGSNAQTIVENVSVLLSNNEARLSMALTENPYGDGTASVKIMEKIIEHHESH